MLHLFLIFNQSDYLIQIVDINSHTSWQTVQIQISWLLQICKGRTYPKQCKQCRFRSIGFFRSQLIRICTVCKGRTYPSSAGLGLSVWIHLLSEIIYLQSQKRLLLTLLLLNADILYRYKQCRSRSVGFFRSQLI